MCMYTTQSFACQGRGSAHFRYRKKEQAKVDDQLKSQNATHQVKKDRPRTHQPHNASIEMQELQDRQEVLMFGTHYAE